MQGKPDNTGSQLLLDFSLQPLQRPYADSHAPNKPALEEQLPPSKKPVPRYQLTRSKRKTLAVFVEHGELQVRAPVCASLADIEAFLDEKQAWIDKQFIHEARRERERLQLAQGARFLVLGTEYCLSLDERTGTAARKRSSVKSTGQELVIAPIATTNATREQQIEKLFGRWLISTAGPYLEMGSRRLANALSLSSKLRNIGFRFTRSKWGHCTALGDLQYNPAIALAPLPVVDYIIAHEVCHLRHRNHSASFWKLVQRACPGWRESEDWLRNDGHKAEFRALQPAALEKYVRSDKLPP